MIQLTGRRFGSLVVMCRTDDNVLPSGLHEPMWKCRCDCGTIVNVRGAYLRSGHTKSCGCRKNVKVGLAGRVINGISVLRRHGTAVPVMYECQCHCGKLFITRGSSLLNGHTKSCGCRKKQLRINDMIGQRFGKLLVICRASDRLNPNGTRDIRWKCRCDCGRIVTVRGSLLRCGDKQSCGCDVQSIHSYGELWCAEWLSEHGINYIWNKAFDDLRGVNGGLLSYDFAVKRDRVLWLIEIQGSQHYAPLVSMRQLIHDQRKLDYVTIHPELRLFRFKYLDHNHTTKEMMFSYLQDIFK